MNKKTIFIGIGILAVGGLVYYLMSKSSSVDSSTKSLADTSTGGASNDNSSTSVDETLGASKFHSAGSSKKQVRVNCRVEARNLGLRGRAKREWRRNCKKNGGYDDGIDM